VPKQPLGLSMEMDALFMRTRSQWRGKDGWGHCCAFECLFLALRNWEIFG